MQPQALSHNSGQYLLLSDNGSDDSGVRVVLHTNTTTAATATATATGAATATDTAAEKWHILCWPSKKLKF